MNKEIKGCIYLNLSVSVEIFSTWRRDFGCWRSMGSPHNSILTLEETDDCWIVSHIVLVRHQWNPPSHHSNEWWLSREPFSRLGQRTDPSLAPLLFFFLFIDWLNWRLKNATLSRIKYLDSYLSVTDSLQNTCSIVWQHGLLRKLIMTFSRIEWFLITKTFPKCLDKTWVVLLLSSDMEIPEILLSLFCYFYITFNTWWEHL